MWKVGEDFGDCCGCSWFVMDGRKAMSHSAFTDGCHTLVSLIRTYSNTKERKKNICNHQTKEKRSESRPKQTKMYEANGAGWEPVFRSFYVCVGFFILALLRWIDGSYSNGETFICLEIVILNSKPLEIRGATSLYLYPILFTCIFLSFFLK